jgi:hypothetical protein
MTMNSYSLTCTCNARPGGAPDSTCQAHGVLSQRLDLAAIAGMRVGASALANITEADLAPACDLVEPTPEITAPCGCDMPVLFGHDTDCMQHPAPIASEPLQLLISATELIDNQPTTEQWHTIKKAILALARLDATARSE